jgi:hypothetical protein
MLKYLKKFVLDILPSVVATIVGAYIVHHYVIPAATPDKPAAATAATTSKADGAASDKDAFVKGVAEKTAIEKTAEKAAEKSPEAPAADSRKRHTTVRSAKAPVSVSDQTASVSDSVASEERRDANDLARAAIERLRTTSEPPRTVATSPAQPARETPSTLPPLSPAVTLTSTPPDVFNAGTGAVMTPARLPQSVTPTRSASAVRPTPPAEIPGAPPLDLHTDPVERTTVAEDVLSAAKSVFHAVLPR